MEVRYTEMETTVTKGCRSLQGYTEEFACRIQASYFRTEVTDVLTWFAVARFAELRITGTMVRMAWVLGLQRATRHTYCGRQHQACAVEGWGAHAGVNDHGDQHQGIQRGRGGTLGLRGVETDPVVGVLVWCGRKRPAHWQRCGGMGNCSMRCCLSGVCGASLGTPGVG